MGCSWPDGRLPLTLTMTTSPTELLYTLVLTCLFLHYTQAVIRAGNVSSFILQCCEHLCCFTSLEKKCQNGIADFEVLSLGVTCSGIQSDFSPSQAAVKQPFWVKNADRCLGATADEFWIITRLMLLETCQRMSRKRKSLQLMLKAQMWKFKMSIT